MEQYGPAVAYALLFWWFSTGLILYLDGLPRHTFKWSVGAASLLMVGALIALSATRDGQLASDAYVAFTCALLCWGWQEMAFLMGYVTGRVPAPDHPPPQGRGRFKEAFLALLHHELSLLAGGCVIVLITWDAPNQIGAWTYGMLWVMRLSAKLNLFLGVPNVNADLLPTHLQHLRRYLRQRSMNALFPFSVGISTIAAVLLVQQILAPGATLLQQTGLTLIVTMLGLGILEHWLMVLPWRGEILWRWGLRSREPAGSTAVPADLPVSPVSVCARPSARPSRR